MPILRRVLAAFLMVCLVYAAALPAHARDIGDGFYLTNQRAFAAINDESFFVLSFLVERENVAGIMKLVENGQVVVLPKGSRVLLVDSVVDDISRVKKAIPVTVRHQGKKYVLLSSVIQ